MLIEKWSIYMCEHFREHVLWAIHPCMDLNLFGKEKAAYFDFNKGPLCRNGTISSIHSNSTDIIYMLMCMPQLPPVTQWTSLTVDNRHMLWNANAIYHTQTWWAWSRQQQRVVFQLADVDIYRCCAVFEYHRGEKLSVFSCIYSSPLYEK